MNKALSVKRIDSSRMRTTRSSSRLPGGGRVCLGCVHLGASAWGWCLPRGCLPMEECLPRGCLPRGQCLPRGGCLPRGCLPRGVSAGGDICPGSVWQTPLPVNRMTDRCKNITLPQLRRGRLKSNSHNS